MDQKVIDFAFRVMIKKRHPDHNGGTPEANRTAQSVNEARRVLSNPVLRAKYDAEVRQNAEAAERSRAKYEAELVRRLQEVGKAILALQSQKKRAEKEARQLRTEMQAVRDQVESKVRRAETEAQARFEKELQSTLSQCDAKANELVSMARAEAERHVRASAVVRVGLEEKRRVYQNLIADTKRRDQRIRLLALPITITMVLAFVSPAWQVDKNTGQLNGQRTDKQKGVISTETIQTVSSPVPRLRTIVADSVQDAPKSLPAPPVATPDDAGLPADRLFHPRNKFMVESAAPQPIKLRGRTVGYFEANHDYPIDEIYQSSPGSSKIYYHVAGGWVHGRLDESHCINGCQEVWPSTRSGKDARAEDRFLLRAKTLPLSESDGEDLQPGKVQMRARCNIVSNPIKVDRQNRDHIVGFFIRDGEDTNLLGDAPVLKMGERVTIEDSYIAPGYAHWVRVRTDADGHSAQQGWVSTSCLTPNATTNISRRGGRRSQQARH